MRGWLLLIIVAAVGVWWGGQNAYIGFRDRTQLEITCADYVQKRPSDHWLKLTQCEYDFDHMAYEGTKGNIRAVYMPLRPVGVEGGPTHIVVKRTDKEMLRVAEALENDEAKPQPAFDNIIAQLEKPAEGLVLFGLDLDDKDKELLERLNLGLANDFVIIENGGKPKLLAGLAVLLGALGAITFGVWRIVRRRRAAKAAPPPPPPPPPKSTIEAFERPI